MVDKTTLVVSFFVAAVLAGLFVQYGPSSVESFIQQETGMPLNAPGMGPFDQTSIPGAEGWLSSEPLPVSQMPVNNPSNANKLMLLADNKVSPECCPSAFSTDVGCVCLSENDKNLFSSRGGNKL